MSIASAIAAERGEMVRVKWLSELIKAREEKDWGKIDELIKVMSKFYFSE